MKPTQAVSELREYTVTHMIGVAGISEKEVNRQIVEADSEQAALARVTDWPHGLNPDSPQRGSGRWNDYWMAERSLDGIVLD